MVDGGYPGVGLWKDSNTANIFHIIPIDRTPPLSYGAEQ